MKDQIIITLGREHGSGGHYIADMIARELGIKLYDKDSIESEIVSEGYSEELIRRTDGFVAMAPYAVKGGIVRTADNAPLFAVRGKTAFVSPAEACVEQELGLRAVEAAGLELEERPVMRDELPRFDELFYVDHRGVTALAHCDGHPCMAILAERVAQSLGGLFPKM